MEPVNINLSSLLPEISPNYRPVGFPLDNQSKKIITEDEALSKVMANKNMRYTYFGIVSLVYLLYICQIM